TIAALSTHLTNQVLQTMESPPTAAALLTAVEDNRIAVVGLACRFPGGVDTPESFWELLSGGVDAISETPPNRWDLDRLYGPDPDVPGKLTTRWGGFLADVDQWDAGFFQLSPREAKALDPQQRLLLEVTWEALERAGLTQEQLFGSDTGVYVGICSTDYQ